MGKLGVFELIMILIVLGIPVLVVLLVMSSIRKKDRSQAHPSGAEQSEDLGQERTPPPPYDQKS